MGSKFSSIELLVGVPVWPVCLLPSPHPVFLFWRFFVDHFLLDLAQLGHPDLII